MRLQLIALATSLPIAGGFASHTCVDDDAAVPQLAGSLGVSGVTSCAEVVAAGYCPHIPEHLRGYCCATCAGYEASDRSARNGAVKETEYGTRYCNIMNYANLAEPWHTACKMPQFKGACDACKNCDALDFSVPHMGPFYGASARSAYKHARDPAAHSPVFLTRASRPSPLSLQGRALYGRKWRLSL